jgi:hypothetical protein
VQLTERVKTIKKEEMVSFFQEYVANPKTRRKFSSRGKTSSPLASKSHLASRAETWLKHSCYFSFSVEFRTWLTSF